MKKSIILNSIFIVLMIIMIIFSIQIDFFFPVPLTGLTEKDIPKQVEPIDTSGGTNPDAPIEIIEFADFSCFFCKESYPAVKQIREEYGSRINYVFKHMPQNAISYRAHLAAECARTQDNFMQYHDSIFIKQDISDDALIDIAGSLSLDMKTFKACISSKEKESIIMQDIRDAELNNIMGTPIYIINDEIIVGSQSYESLKDVIEKQLDPARIASDILGGSQ